MRKLIFSAIGVLSLSTFFQAQTCFAFANIPANGTTTVNGIQVTTSSSGCIFEPFTSTGGCVGASALLASNAIRVGANGPGSLTLNFDQPVNDITFTVIGVRPNETLSVTSSSGDLSLLSNDSCGITMSSNSTFYGSANYGNGIFKVHALSPYTQLTVTDSGNGLGSLLNICESSIVLGTDDVNVKSKDNLVSIYPNPAKDHFTISAKENLRSYKIYDQSGREIMGSSLKGTEQEVNISSLIKGTYTVSVETEHQKVNKKIVKN